MKVVIFAGGVGSRLWPLSRKNTPKQFERIVGEQSMLQLAVSKLFPDFEWSDIFISTNSQFEEILKEQFPQLPVENLILEPAMRDVGPAVGLVTANILKRFPDEQMAILWSDHLIERDDEFRKALRVARNLIESDSQKIVFIGQKPRFASVNLGYLEFGGEVQNIEGISVTEYKGIKYRPDEEEAKGFVADHKHAWNLGYFVTTPKFLWSAYKEFAPDVFAKLDKIHNSVDTADYKLVLEDVYPTIDKTSFDNMVLEKLNPNSGLVISVDIGWSDIGAWEALKEALAGSDDENVTRGKVELMDTRDSLIFNYNNQLVVGLDLDGMLVINTGDVLLVCPKESVPKIKKFVESLKGTEHQDLA